MTEQEPARKRVTPVNLVNAVVIVVLIQLVALGITYENLPSYTAIVASSGPTFAPAGTSETGSFLNASFLVVFAFASTLGLLWVLRRKMVFSFKVLIFASVAISAFLLTFITADSVLAGILPVDQEAALDVAVSMSVVVIVGYTIFIRNRPWLSSIVLAFVGAEVGAFFAGTLDLRTALVLPVVFSAYDVYAVFKGPLKHLVGTAPGLALNGMSVKLGEFTLGLGDVVFYTMIPSLALFHTVVAPTVSPLAPVAVIAAIDAGVLATLLLLTRKRLLPGLPIPMILGVGALAFYLL
ncbi:MAG: hypothetical protein HY296_02855 [Thaumarchaeota archaeon]|nr:hypothetical protein [Nitrososphaerota archaeon]